MMARICPASLAASVILGAAFAAADQPAPVADPEIHIHAYAELTSALKELTALRDAVLRELAGQEYYGIQLDEGGYYHKLRPQQIEQWFNVAGLQSLVREQEAALAEWRKPNRGDMTEDDFIGGSYRRVGYALQLQWEARLFEIGAAPSASRRGRVAILEARCRQAEQARSEEYYKERDALKKLDAAERDAGMARLVEHLKAEDRSLREKMAEAYREAGRRLQAARKDLCGRTWLWQDFAFKRSAARGDVHDRWQAEFRKFINFWFDLRSPRGDVASLHYLDQTRFWFSAPIGEPGAPFEKAWPDLQTDSDLRTFCINGLLTGHVEDFRRYAGLPPTRTSGTTLEQLIQSLHQRLSTQRRIRTQMASLEEQMSNLADRAEKLERLAAALAAYRDALAALLSAAEASVKAAEREKEAKALQERLAAALEGAEKAARKAGQDRDTFAGELVCDRNGAVVHKSNRRAGLTYRPIAEFERTLRERIANLKMNPNGPNQAANLKEVEELLQSVGEQRKRLMEPKEAAVARAAQACDAARKACEDARTQAARPTGEARAPTADELSALLSAAGEARRAAAAPEFAGLLSECGLRLSATEFSAAVGAAEIRNSCRPVAESVAKALESVSPGAAAAIESLRRAAGDYAAAIAWREQLECHALSLRADGARTAEAELLATQKVTEADQVIVELRKLQKGLDKALKPFSRDGRLTPPEKFGEYVGNKAWDEILARIPPTKKVLKALKTGAKTLELLEQLGNRDPEALATALKLGSELIGKLPTGPILSHFLTFYSDAALASVQQAKRIQSQIVNDTLAAHFHDNQAGSPERRLYTAKDVAAIVTDRLQDSGQIDFQQIATMFQIRRLLHLVAAEGNADIGQRP